MFIGILAIAGLGRLLEYSGMRCIIGGGVAPASDSVVDVIILVRRTVVYGLRAHVVCN